MKTVLCAIDYSSNSAAALKYAHKLSRELKTRLVICHIYDDPEIWGVEGLESSFAQLEKQALKLHRQKLETFCDTHLDENWKSSDLVIQPAENHSVLKGIISIAEQWHAELIALGAKGQNALREAILGSTTKRLIEKAPCPVLAIPEDAGYRPFKTVVYATDYEEEDVYTLLKVAEMAKVFDAKLKVAHVVTEKDQGRKTRMEAFRDSVLTKVDYPGIEFKLLVGGKVFESLQKYLSEVKADLIVMLEREKKGLFQGWFHKDLVKKMETHSQVPLLSYREYNHKPFYFST